MPLVVVRPAEGRIHHWPPYLLAAGCFKDLATSTA
jgi:hypothetical protein